MATALAIVCIFLVVATFIIFKITTHYFNAMVTKLAGGASKSVVGTFVEEYGWIVFVESILTVALCLIYVQNYAFVLVPLIGARAYEIALYHNLCEWYHSLKEDDDAVLLN